MLSAQTQNIHTGKQEQQQVCLLMHISVKSCSAVRDKNSYKLHQQIKLIDAPDATCSCSFTSVRLPLQSFTTGCLWIIRNPVFSRCHFLDPSEGFCPTTCCGDWGLRGLTAINAEGLATEHLTEDPGSHYLGCNNTLCLTWRLFQSLRSCRYSTTTVYVTRRHCVTVFTTSWTL